jgi:hypothetical protein
MQSAGAAGRHSPPIAQVGSTQHSPAAWLQALLETQPPRKLPVVELVEVVVVVVHVVVVVVVVDEELELEDELLLEDELELEDELLLVDVGGEPPLFSGNDSSSPLAQFATPSRLPPTANPTRSQVSTTDFKLLDIAPRYYRLGPQRSPLRNRPPTRPPGGGGQAAIPRSR